MAYRRTAVTAAGGGSSSESTGWSYVTGADATGAADATSIINAAITAANSVYASTGLQQTVYLGPGKFKANGIVPKDGVILKGAGRKATVLLPSSTVPAIQALRTQASPLTDAGFEDFGIDGAGQTGAYAVSKKGIYTQFHQDVTFRRLDIRNTIASGLGSDFFHGHCLIDEVTAVGCGRTNGGSNPGGNGIGLGVGGFDDNLDTVTVTKCYASGAAQYGIMVERQETAGAGTLGYNGRGVRIIGNYATGNKHGIVDSGAVGAIISGNSSVANTSNGIALNQGTLTANVNGSRPGSRGIIAGNYCGSNGGSGIAVDTASYYSALTGYLIQGNVCDRNTAAGIKIAPGQFEIRDLDIRGNLCKHNGANGIWFDLLAGAAGGVGCTRCTVVGNDCSENTTRGIYFNADMRKCYVAGNKCYDDQGTPTQTSGIVLAGTKTLTDCELVDNDTRSIPTTGWNLAGTVTTCRMRGNLGAVSGSTPGNGAGPVSRTVTASPQTYTAGPVPEVLYVQGGTVSSIVKGGVTLASTTDRSIPLDPNEAVVITYSSAPTLTADRK